MVDRAITSENLETYLLPFSAQGKAYRVTVTSPCGDYVDTQCHPIPQAMRAIQQVTPHCEGGSSEPSIRYAMKAFFDKGYDPYAFSGRGSVEIDSDNDAYDEIIPSVGRELVLTRPRSILPATFTYRDPYGWIATERIEDDLNGFEFYAEVSYNCSDIGNAGIAAYFGGNVPGFAEPGTEYQLYKVVGNESHFVTKTTQVARESDNMVVFPNLTLQQGDDYFVRVVPAGSGCSATDSPVWRVPATPDGLTFQASPSVIYFCNKQPDVHLNPTVSPGVEVQYGFDYAEHSDIKRISEPYVYNVGWGNAVWRMTMINYGCENRVISGNLRVNYPHMFTTIDRLEAVNCQQLNQAPQETGSVYLEFSGVGPFDIYLRSEADADFPATALASGVSTNHYTIEDLQEGTRYVVKVVSRCGRSATREFSIRPLTVRLVRHNLAPCFGQSFYIEAIDIPTASYLWQKWTGTGWATVRAGRELVFLAYSISDNGRYRLLVDVMNGCVERSMEFTLNSARCSLVQSLGSIGDVVWHDRNLNGLQDPTEPPLAGAQVNLEFFVGPVPNTGLPNEVDLRNSANWTEIATTLSDQDGLYLFNDLKEGFYRVKVKYEGYRPSPVKVGSNDPSNILHNGDSNILPDGYSEPIRIQLAYDYFDYRRNNWSVDAGLAEEVALPVRLVFFTAVATTEGSVDLRWKTAEEMNSSHFEIHRSVDGKEWQTIGTVKSNTGGEYSFTDSDPLTGFNYYRLNMVDLDDSFAYSPTVNVRLRAAKDQVTLYPNPARESVDIRYSGGKQLVKIEVFDLSGRKVLVADRPAAKEAFSVVGLNAGIYLVNLKFDDASEETQRMVVAGI